MRTTRTFVTMDLSQAAFEEIKAKLQAAGYFHAINHLPYVGECLDMHGIAITAEKQTNKEEKQNDKH